MNKRTVRLVGPGYDYEATFCYSAEMGLTMEWSPFVPKIKGRRRIERFLQAYRIARDEYAADIATEIGGDILIIDLDGNRSVIHPRIAH